MNHPASVYLSQYGAMKQRVEALQRELEYLQAVAALAGCSVDVGRRIIENLKECLDMRLWLLDQMQNPTEKLVLTYRYINGMEWLDIQHKMHYEASMTYKIHRSALDHFWEIKELNS